MIVVLCQVSNSTAISWKEKVIFTLSQQRLQLDLCNTSSLKQQSAGDFLLHIELVFELNMHVIVAARC